MNALSDSCRSVHYVDAGVLTLEDEVVDEDRPLNEWLKADDDLR